MEREGGRLREKEREKEREREGQSERSARSILSIVGRTNEPYIVYRQ